MIDAQLADMHADRHRADAQGRMFFCTDQRIPSRSSSSSPRGFWLDPRETPGHLLPAGSTEAGAGEDPTMPQPPPPLSSDAPLYEQRMLLGAHLGLYLRSTIEAEIGLTLSAGVAHCKMASKMVGAAHKPNKQTVWLPSHESRGNNADADDGYSEGLARSSVAERLENEARNRDRALQEYIRPLDIRKINGFGFSINNQMKEALGGKQQGKYGRPTPAPRPRMGNGEYRAVAIDTPGMAPAHPEADQELAPELDAFSTADEGVAQRWWDDAPAYRAITVDLALKAFSAESLCDLFGARLGSRLWSLLQGVDEEGVTPAPEFPAQISVEDTYRRLEGEENIVRQIHKLSESLLRRLESELLDGEVDRNEVLHPKVRRRDDFMHDQGIDGVVRSYIDVDEEEAQEGKEQSEPQLEFGQQQEQPKRTWRRYPLGLRLGTRQGFSNRVTRQTRMPVGIFDLSFSPLTTTSSSHQQTTMTPKEGRAGRARLIASACIALFKAIMAAEGDAGKGINLLNIAAIDLSKQRPAQSIGAMLQLGAAAAAAAGSAGAKEVHQALGGAATSPRRVRASTETGVGAGGRVSREPGPGPGPDPAILAQLGLDLAAFRQLPTTCRRTSSARVPNKDQVISRIKSKSKSRSRSSEPRMASSTTTEQQQQQQPQQQLQPQ